jgi:hypothetical protein
VRELMRDFDGQVVAGALFGQPGSISLPRFERVEAFQSTDGQIELDAVAQTTQGRRWIVEVKWKNKRAGRKELERLHVQAQEQSAQAWYISRSGFTEDAMRFAEGKKVYITDAQGIKRLRDMLK